MMINNLTLKLYTIYTNAVSKWSVNQGDGDSGVCACAASMNIAPGKQPVGFTPL